MKGGREGLWDDRDSYLSLRRFLSTLVYYGDDFEKDRRITDIYLGAEESTHSSGKF